MVMTLITVEPHDKKLIHSRRAFISYNFCIVGQDDNAITHNATKCIVGVSLSGGTSDFRFYILNIIFM